MVSKYCYALWLLGLMLLVGCSTAPIISNDDQISSAELITKNPYSQINTAVDDEAKYKFAAAENAIKDKDFKNAEQALLWLIEHYPHYSGPFLNLAIFSYLSSKLQGSLNYSNSGAILPNSISWL